MRYLTISLALFLVLPACSKKADPADAVRALIKQCEEHANNGDHAGLTAALAADYRDAEGRDRDAVAKRAGRHLKRHSKRFVHARPLSINVSGEAAQAAVIVALAGKRIGPKDDLLKVSADLIKLKLKLRNKDGAGWLVVSALWTRPSPLDVL
jgi:hypothetical protein